MERSSLVEQSADGRVARRDRNRQAVLDAVIELFSENNIVPDVHEVVERSGVSLRSVYRYFEDRTSLLYAAIERHSERTRPIAKISDIGHGSLDDRIAALVDQRMRLNETLGPTFRACCTLGATNELLERELHRSMRVLGDQIALQFGPEIAAVAPSDRVVLTAALDAASGLSSIDHLRRVLGHDRATTRAVVERTLHALLDPR